jgi:hypothetical protein
MSLVLALLDALRAALVARTDLVLDNLDSDTARPAPPPLEGRRFDLAAMKKTQPSPECLQDCGGIERSLAEL